jgi:hypothetical protein
MYAQSTLHSLVTASVAAVILVHHIGDERLWANQLHDKVLSSSTQLVVTAVARHDGEGRVSAWWVMSERESH